MDCSPDAGARAIHVRGRKLIYVARPLAGFANARAEFHSALAHYRKGKFTAVLANANHGFESTMKIIASKTSRPFNETDTAAKLVNVMIINGLCPPMRQAALTGLRTMLESDVPTLRNKAPSSGHGAETKTPTVPVPIATYAIGASAANIWLLPRLFHKKDSRRKRAHRAVRCRQCRL
jgi:hypothetical protein